MKLNEAISARLTELLQERDMTQYQLFMQIIDFFDSPLFAESNLDP